MKLKGTQTYSIQLSFIFSGLLSALLYGVRIKVKLVQLLLCSSALPFGVEYTCNICLGDRGSILNSNRFGFPR